MDTRRTALLAFDGTDFVVAWSDDRGGNAIYVGRVDQDGAVLDPDGVAVAASGSPWGDAPIASAPGSSFVVWSGPYAWPTADVWGVRIGPDGLPPAAGARLVSVGNRAFSRPAVAFKVCRAAVRILGKERFRAGSYFAPPAGGV